MSNHMNNVLFRRSVANREDNPAEPDRDSSSDVDAGSSGTQPLPPPEPTMSALLGRAYRRARERR